MTLGWHWRLVGVRHVGAVTEAPRRQLLQAPELPQPIMATHIDLYPAIKMWGRTRLLRPPLVQL